MDNFFTHFWASITNSLDNIANNADQILLTLIKIILIILLAKVVIVVANAMIRKSIKQRLKKHPDSMMSKKSQTVGTLLQSIIRYLVYFFAVATILAQLNMGITAGSILATAGIGGIAIGLGAQAIIKDVLSGFFLLFENQFSVGDYVEIAGLKGTVEAITVRTTQVRAFTGELIILPNGSIEKVINYTRGNAVVILDILIANNEDPKPAIELMKDCCQEYADTDPDVVDVPDIIGVANINQDGIQLRAFIKVRALTQFKVERELKAKIYEAYRLNGVDVPYPKRVVIDNQK